MAGLAAMLVAVMQVPEVRGPLRERASLRQGYDVGPEGRFGGQQKAIGLMLDTPLGIGPFTCREVYHHEEVHNVYITQSHNAGWLGAFAYIASVLLTLAVGMRRAWRPGPLQGFLAVATATFAGVVVEGMVINSDHWRHFFIVMGLIWGCADARTAPDRQAARREGDDDG